MTIDEVIQIEKHYGKKDKKALEELQNEFPMIDGIMDNNLHEQIAEWLEEFKDLKDDAIPIIHGKAELELHDKEIRAKAIDEFTSKLKNRLIVMQIRELRGKDVCPCAETGEECPYINQDIGCQYCAREHTIKVVDEIAERMKEGAV